MFCLKKINLKEYTQKQFYEQIVDLFDNGFELGKEYYIHLYSKDIVLIDIPIIFIINKLDDKDVIYQLYKDIKVSVTNVYDNIIYICITYEYHIDRNIRDNIRYISKNFT